MQLSFPFSISLSHCIFHIAYTRKWKCIFRVRFITNTLNSEGKICDAFPDCARLYTYYYYMRKEKKVGSFNIDTYRTLAEKAKKERMSLVCLCFSWMNFLKTYLKHYSRVEKYVYGTFLCSIEKMNENCLAIWISISCVHFFIILLSENRP